MELKRIVSQKIAANVSVTKFQESCINELKKPAQCAKIVDELFGLRTNLVPNRVQLASYDDVEGPEIRIFDLEIVQIQLQQET